jgi:hypothetical protein
MRLGGGEKAVFWGSGFVSAQLQGFSNLRLRQRPMIGITRQNPKILAPHGYSFSSNALARKPFRLGRQLNHFALSILEWRHIFNRKVKFQAFPYFGDS